MDSSPFMYSANANDQMMNDIGLEESPRLQMDSEISHFKNFGRKRKGAREYATEFQDDFVSKIILQNGMHVNVLVCKFCAMPIGARSDRIKEHLSSKRHMKLKAEKTKPVSVNGNQPRRKRVASSTYIPPSSSFSSSTTFGNGGEMRENMNSASGIFGAHQYQDFKSLPPAPSPYLLNYCLRWEKHGIAFRKAFIGFWETGQLTDVMLVAGSYMTKCHKVVLSACSDYFADLFKKDPFGQNTVVFKPRDSDAVEKLVHFMYYGEVTIPKKDMKSVLEVAKTLKIQGLVQPKLPGSGPASEANAGFNDGRVNERSAKMRIGEVGECRKDQFPIQNMTTEEMSTSSGGSDNDVTLESDLPALLPITLQPSSIASCVSPYDTFQFKHAGLQVSSTPRASSTLTRPWEGYTPSSNNGNMEDDDDVDDDIIKLITGNNGNVLMLAKTQSQQSVNGAYTQQATVTSNLMGERQSPNFASDFSDFNNYHHPLDNIKIENVRGASGHPNQTYSLSGEGNCIFANKEKSNEKFDNEQFVNFIKKEKETY